MRKYINIILVFCSLTVSAQKDTIHLSISSPNGLLYNQELSDSVNPFFDKIYDGRDSSEFNGFVCVCSHHLSDPDRFLYFSVKNGISIYHILTLDGIVIDSTFIGSDLNNRYEHSFSFDGRGNLTEERYTIDGVFDGRYYQLLNDSTALTLYFSVDTLKDVSNKDVIYVSENLQVVSEEEFLIAGGANGYWNYTVLTTREEKKCPNYDIILYTTGTNFDFNPYNKKHRRKIIKKTSHNSK